MRRRTQSRHLMRTYYAAIYRRDVVRIPVPGGFNTRGQVAIQQLNPLPLRVMTWFRKCSAAMSRTRSSRRARAVGTAPRDSNSNGRLHDRRGKALALRPDEPGTPPRTPDGARRLSDGQAGSTPLFDESTFRRACIVDGKDHEL